MKVITGPDTRWSYANVWEPKSINGGTPKYSVSLIIPKSDTRTVAKIKAPSKRLPRGRVQAQRKRQDRAAAGAIRTRSRRRRGTPDDPPCQRLLYQRQLPTAPGIVDADLNPVLTPPGVLRVYGRASINLYAFLQMVIRV